MRKLRIVWLEDSRDCEICGGSYANGFRAYLDGELIDEFEPFASCFDGQTIEGEEVWSRLFKHFDIELETDYE